MEPNRKKDVIEKFYLYATNLIQKSVRFIIPHCRRIIRFLALPYCYCYLTNWKEIKISKTQVFKDFLYIYFKLKYYPDNYSPCRFFEKERDLWHYYYGSNYDPFQRSKLRRQLQPKEYEILFEDKEVCKQLCQSANLPMPETLGVVDIDTDYREHIKAIFINSGRNELIIKPVRGSAGRGVIKIIKKDGKHIAFSKNESLSLEDFTLCERSLIQEVVSQHSEISKISESSINTIRVLTLLSKSKKVIILGSTMRFGIGNSHIDNWSAGGIAVGVDTESGKLKKTAFDKKGNQYTKHPISKVDFIGFDIPEWLKIKELSIDTQLKFQYFKLLGLDIAISKNGPVIIEINAFPDFVFQEQTSGPLLVNRENLVAFKEYDLLINKYQKAL